MREFFLFFSGRHLAISRARKNCKCYKRIKAQRKTMEETIRIYIPVLRSKTEIGSPVMSITIVTMTIGKLIPNDALSIIVVVF